MIDKALAYLKSQQADGSWQRGPREPVAITALVLRAFASDEKFGPHTDFVHNGYARLLASSSPTAASTRTCSPTTTPP